MAPLARKIKRGLVNAWLALIQHVAQPDASLVMRTT
jgi:hypothetical protein